MKKIVFFFLFYLISITNAVSEDAKFIVSDIQVEGLHRISAGTVFNNFPIEIGDEADKLRIANAIKQLYQSGFFSDVGVARENDELIVIVVERPAIARIEISGNDEVDTEPLLEGLKGIGMAEGDVFSDQLLDQLGHELERQYFGLGKYGVKIESSITPLERNRVAVSIDIQEGEAATIRQIRIIGNEAFTDEELFDKFSLGTTKLFSFYTHNDQYSKPKLAADVEKLRSFYLNSGYIKFKIRSTQVSITPDKKDIYITINIDEGNVHTISEVKLAGEYDIDPSELVALVELGPGETFSRKATNVTAENIERKLGDYGYAFANVNTIPDIDEDENTVAITFFIDPGRRVYVRRLNMDGNTRTRDEALRREMRQLESSWISTAKVERSRVRLQKTGYFEEVNVETPAVPGMTDQVDVNFSVVERPSGNLLAGLGFSQSQGLIFNTSVTQDNFLGTGKRISFALNNSELSETYQFSYTNPYYTVDGISRGFLLSYRKTDVSEVDISDFSTDVISFGINYGVPVNEFDRVRFRLQYDNTELKLGSFPAEELVDFVDENGSIYDTLTLTTSWSHDTRNRSLFADDGRFYSLSAEASLPGGDLEFYKLQAKGEILNPLFAGLVLRMKSDIAVGGAYGGTSELPLFENFFAGGSKSVRGFEDFSLGPLDSNGDPLGGDLKLTGSIEVLFPAPSKALKNSLRLGAFVDVGNVFGSGFEFEASELRISTGISVFWISPVGPLRFSLALPLNDKDDDEVQVFQFSLGAI